MEPTVIFNLSGDEKNGESISDLKHTFPYNKKKDWPNEQHNKRNHVVFEADSNALYDLYQNIELIQEKLDELKQ